MFQSPHTNAHTLHCAQPEHSSLVGREDKPTLWAGTGAFGPSASGILLLAAESALAEACLCRFSLPAFLPSGVALCPSAASACHHACQSLISGA